MPSPDRTADLRTVLAEARRHGFLGPGPVDAHIDHARSFAGAHPDVPTRALDLGSGGGVPGLVLVLHWPESRWVLLDAGERRAAFLTLAVAELGLSARVSVHRERAEIAGREASLRGGFDLVTARSFGGPGVTAECGAPFLRVGGRLLVSEPPVATPRWPVLGLDQLGLVPGPRVDGDGGHIQVLVAAAPCPDRFPRRVGIPGKRPLF